MNRFTQIFLISVLSFIIGIFVSNYKIFPFSIIKKIYKSTLYNIIYDSSDVIKKRWKGPWDSNINYIENDCVYYEGNSFLSIKDNINQAPIKNSTYWDTTTIYGKWSIGIFQGESVFNLSDPINISNPIISASDVTDCDAYFVADPFLYISDSTFYLFFEILNKSSNQGDIGYAISQDLINGKWVAAVDGRNN